MHSLQFLVFLILQCSPSQGWNYGSSGPDTWPADHPECGGELQSPVNVVIGLAENEIVEESVAFMNYEEEWIGSILNNGHTVSFQIEGGSQAFVTGGSLGEAR